MGDRPQNDLDTVRRDPRRYGLTIENDRLHMDGVDLEAIATAVGTPTYVYGLDTIVARVRRLQAALSGRPVDLCFAVKANSNAAVLRRLFAAGCGADIVSGGELARVLAAGVAADRVVFSGVGKTAAEIDQAIEAGVRSINVESDFELDLIHARTTALGKSVSIAFRMNPEVDAKTHPYLATGLEKSKFGIAAGAAPELMRRVHDLPGVALTGLACHIGSQIVTAEPYTDAAARMRELVEMAQAAGHTLKHLDLGGGLGIPYEPGDATLDAEAWGAAIVAATKDLPLTVTLEPGRYLVANAGVMLTRVLGRKSAPARDFAVVDGAMNDLLRPSLYGGYHGVAPVRVRGDQDAPALATMDVVGPVCESGDFLAQQRPLPADLEAGEVLAILSAGAYGATMGGTYNTRPLPPEVVTSGGEFAVARARGTVEALLAVESPPGWADRVGD